MVLNKWFKIPTLQFFLSIFWVDKWPPSWTACNRRHNSWKPTKCLQKGSFGIPGATMTIEDEEQRQCDFRAWLQLIFEYYFTSNFGSYDSVSRKSVFRFNGGFEWRWIPWLYLAMGTLVDNFLGPNYFSGHNRAITMGQSVLYTSQTLRPEAWGEQGRVHRPGSLRPISIMFE